jgi:hypothetical protein
MANCSRRSAFRFGESGDSSLVVTLFSQDCSAGMIVRVLRGFALVWVNGSRVWWVASDSDGLAEDEPSDSRFGATRTRTYSHKNHGDDLFIWCGNSLGDR